MRSLVATLSLCLLFGWTGEAQARPHHHKHHSHASHHRTVSLASGLVTVQTAAGISITVASHLASQFQGFISDLVAQGYKPKHIGCFARGGHVSNSRHYAGAACDIDQSGWGKTARPMYHVAALAAKHGLRDGCTFRDCGHVDDGSSVRKRYARAL